MGQRTQKQFLLCTRYQVGGEMKGGRKAPFQLHLYASEENNSMDYVETKSLVSKIPAMRKGLLSLGEVFVSLPLL